MDKPSRGEGREDKVEDSLTRQWGSHEQKPEAEKERGLNIQCCQNLKCCDGGDGGRGQGSGKK